MGLFPSLVEVRNVSRSSGSPDVFDDFWYGSVGGSTKSGARVNKKTAMSYLTVARCVMLLAADLARLPLILYRKMPGGGKVRQTDHPLYDILHDKPNPETTSYLWREAGQGNLTMLGNSYSEIKRHPYSDAVLSLWQVDNPETVQVKRDKNKQLYYEYFKDGKKVIKKSDDIFHVPGFSFGGRVGLSVLGMVRESIGLGLANDEFTANYFGNGMHVGGAVSMDKDLGEAEKAYKATLKKEFAGLQNVGGVLVFQNGETYTPFKMPLKDAELLDSRRFQKTELCGFYGIPPHKVGIHEKNANRANLEQENQNYVDGALIHWITRWETSISHQLLTIEERKAGLFAEFMVGGLLRGDSVARADYYNKMFQIAGITPNEIRAKENMNPIEGGDDSFVMLNMIPLSQAGESQADNDDGTAARMIERRSVKTRDRIAKQYRPLIKRAAEKIVSLETIAIIRNAEKYRKQRSKAEMEKWLDDFYRKMPDRIKREIGPVFKSFADGIINESAKEIGIDPADVDLKKFISDYIETYSERHISSSVGQMTALLRGEIDDLIERAGEWEEKRPEKIAENETVRAANAVFQAVAFSAGLGTYWRIRGAKTCPYCTELNGRRVSSGESFVSDGDELDPEKGDGPMKIRGMKAHPPLHAGCDCYLSVN